MVKMNQIKEHTGTICERQRVKKQRKHKKRDEQKEQIEERSGAVQVQTGKKNCVRTKGQKVKKKVN